MHNTHSDTPMDTNELKRLATLEINYIGYLSSASGLGMGARMYIDTLYKLGFNKINCIDVTYLTSHSFTETLTHPIASSTKKSDINIIHINPLELPQVIKTLGSHYFKYAYNIGVWAWETSNVPTKWHDRFDMVDEIWALSTFTAETFRKATHIPVIPISYIIPKIASEPSRAYFHFSSDTFVFLFSFDYRSISYRKNPEAVMRAFLAAFPSNENSRLIIKTQNASTKQLYELQSITNDSRIIVLNKTLTTKQQHELLTSCSCYISLHRAEGLGLGMAEAMSLGKPVIATGWSGNMDFMNESNSLLVNYTLKPSVETNIIYPPGTLWAEPDLNHAAELMHSVYSSASLRNKIGMRAKVDIANTMSEATIGQKIKERLALISKERLSQPTLFQNILFTFKNIFKHLPHLNPKSLIKLHFQINTIKKHFEHHWYISQYGTNWKIKLFPRAHYLLFGWKRRYQPHPLFDGFWYLQNNPDVAAASIEPFQHYITHGLKEGRSPHPSCDSSPFLKNTHELL